MAKCTKLCVHTFSYHFVQGCGALGSVPLFVRLFVLRITVV
jgi:hypothetical protein